MALSSIRLDWEIVAGRSYSTLWDSVKVLCWTLRSKLIEDIHQLDEMHRLYKRILAKTQEGRGHDCSVLYVM